MFSASPTDMMNSVAVLEPLGQQEEPMADSGLAIQHLRTWHEEYREPQFVDITDCAPIRAVKSDKLNHKHIERRIQKLAASAGVADGFCIKCRDRFDHWPDTGTPTFPAIVLPWPFNTLELEASTMSGCKLCAFLFSFFTRGPDPCLELVRKVEGRLEALGRNYDTHLLKYSQVVTGGVTREESMRLSLPDGAVGLYRGTDFAALDSLTMDPSVNFSTARSLDMVREWLWECTSTHSPCRNKRKHCAPTRLIWIGDESMRLVLTDEMEQIPAYATLSYCWGLEPFIKLTSETIDAFSVAIPECDLPKTFRDAIFIARELGMSYIWIDALCIIQSDSKDWHLEAGRMHSVYGGSEVTIAASSATDAHQGCFEEPIQHNNGLHARITTSQHCRRQCFYKHAVHTSVTSGALSKRSWAFQERLLSHRVLYCTTYGLFWACRVTCDSEVSPGAYPHNLSQYVCPEDTPWCWEMLVQQYSGTMLSHSSDRLPALSGIASRQGQLRDDQYLAGLWREDLVKQLLWARQTSQPSERPAWQAPTWSWASINGLVIPHNLLRSRKGTKPYVHLANAWTQPVGADCYGPVSAGELTLGCASMLRGSLDDNAISANYKFFRPEVGPGRTGALKVTVLLDCVLKKAARNVDPFYLLPILGVEDVRSPNPGRINKIKGLVLQRCSARKGHFRRIGCFTSTHTGYPQFPVDWQLMDDVGPDVAKAESAWTLSGHHNRDTPYVITIE